MPRGRGRKNLTVQKTAKRNNKNKSQAMVNEVVVQSSSVDFQTDIKSFFLENISVDKHREAQCQNQLKYSAAISLLYSTGVELPANTKIRSLAAAWSRNDHKLANSMLCLRDSYGLVDVLKAVQILDSPRLIRQITKKFEKVQSQAEKTKVELKKSTIAKYKTKLAALEELKSAHGSFSGALCRHVRKWAATFTKEELEFFALQLPVENWRKLADIVHFKPTDFKELPWFLEFCFGKAAPANSVVAQKTELSKGNLDNALENFNVPYSTVRTIMGTSLTDSQKLAIVKSELLDRVIWYYEELACENIDNIIYERLENKEKITLNYGKLMERLVYFSKLTKKPVFLKQLISGAEEMLSATKLKLDEPIVVIADASSSMSVAIETATIIASFLSASVKSELHFFNTKDWEPKKPPRTIDEVIDLALKTKADGCTAPAASLMPFYKKKTVIKTFFMVTDEEENTDFEGTRFTPLFKKYIEEVYPAKLIFISFLNSQTCKGQMVPELMEVTKNVVQFKLNGARPDLTKLDNILGQLASQTEGFDETLKSFEAQIEKQGGPEFFTNLFKKKIQKE